MFRLFLVAVALAIAAGQTPAAGFVGNFQAAPPDPAHQRIAAGLARSQQPQRIADHLNSVLQLPAPVLVQFQQCGQVNAFFNPKQRAVIFCYELMQDMGAKIAARAREVRAGRDQAAPVLGGAMWFILLHEVGHAIHAVADLPTLGRREDVADQLAVWLAIRRPPPGADESILGGMVFFTDASAPTDYEAMGGPHSLHPQRLQNVACWAWGADPVRYRDLPDAVRLPDARRASCAEEWAAIDAAVPRLLGRVLKPARAGPW